MGVGLADGEPLYRLSIILQKIPGSISYHRCLVWLGDRQSSIDEGGGCFTRLVGSLLKIAITREAGFQKVTTYGDFQETYHDSEPDFLIHVAEKAYDSE